MPGNQGPCAEEGGGAGREAAGGVGGETGEVKTEEPKYLKAQNDL